MCSDTAKPNETDPNLSTDPFRATVYKHPSRDWSPYDLLTLPWVANGQMEFPPGEGKVCMCVPLLMHEVEVQYSFPLPYSLSHHRLLTRTRTPLPVDASVARTNPHHQDYSSSNFILLGLVIAAIKGVAWDALDQSAFLTPAARAAGLLQHTKFAAHGPPSEYSNLTAYDRTSYNGHNASALPGYSVSDVHGVLYVVHPCHVALSHFQPRPCNESLFPRVPCFFWLCGGLVGFTSYTKRKHLTTTIMLARARRD